MRNGWMIWGHIHLVFLQDIPDFLPLDVFLLGRVSAFPEEFAEDCSVVVTFGNGYISITVH